LTDLLSYYSIIYDFTFKMIRQLNGWYHSNQLFYLLFVLRHYFIEWLHFNIFDNIIMVLFDILPELVQLFIN